VKRLIALAFAAGLTLLALVAITGPAVPMVGRSTSTPPTAGAYVRSRFRVGAAPADDVGGAARSTRRSFT
jgi:hypothetical protein